MYILIDTNIYFNNWFLKSPQFNLLANYSNNTGSTLLLPSVVCMEVEHKYKMETEAAISDATKLQRRFANLALSADTEWKNPTMENFCFVDIVRSKFQMVEVIDHSLVRHESLINKAINGLKPFRDNEKGYRDALIWLSTIEHIRSAGNNFPIAFINANSSDFFDSRGSVLLLHADLTADLKSYAVSNAFQPFDSIKAFVEENIETGIHSFNHSDFEDKYVDLLEADASYAAIESLNNLSVPDCKLLLDSDRYPPECTKHIVRVVFEDFEGSEDPEIVGITKVAGDDVYIDYRFFLLTVIAQLTISTQEYYSNKTQFDKAFFNAETNGMETNVYAYLKVFFEASIIFNTLEEQVKEFSIDNIRFATRR